MKLIDSDKNEDYMKEDADKISVRAILSQTLNSLILSRLETDAC